jgi:hypothetical protein
MGHRLPVALSASPHVLRTVLIRCGATRGRCLGCSLVSPVGGVALPCRPRTSTGLLGHT